jgi:hypothetical protein
VRRAEDGLATNPAQFAHGPPHPTARRPGRAADEGGRRMSLNVMVLESDPGAADSAARALTEAGHEVLRCHEAGATSFPCNGLEDQSKCPLRSHSVDVALTVRRGVRSEPTPLEDGVRCALMHRTPLVVVGPPVFDPFDAFEARVLADDDDVVGACEEVAVSELPRHSRIATEALRAARNPDDMPAAARVTVTRRHGCLLAAVSGLDELTPRQRDAAIVRMMMKLREYDSSARGIDVTNARVSPDRP